MIAGHRRHAALTALTQAGVNGYDTIACEVREGLSEAEAYALMLTENVQRVPLEPIQAARALRLLLDINEQLDAGGLARSLGLKPAWVQTHLKLLDLPQDVQDQLEAGDLSVTIADLLRKGHATGRLDEDKVRDIAAKVASGEITTAEARKAAAPPPKPNTPAPTTVRAGEAELEASGEWDRIGPSGAVASGVIRPTTPLTGESPRPLESSAQALPRAERAAMSEAAPQRASSGAVELSPEERLDTYLLGRALREWADDAYLDQLGIDRVQTEAYAEALSFDERIGAIRQLSFALLQADLVPA